MSDEETKPEETNEEPKEDSVVEKVVGSLMDTVVDELTDSTFDALMEEAEKRLRALGCPKINLQVRRSNGQVMPFYENIGFKQDDVVSFGKRLVSDERENGC